MNETIKQFWDEQAKTHGESDTATAPDHAYREAEIKAILPYIRGQDILDVGCGNGYSTLKFAARYMHKFFTGIDYSDAMIEQAALTAKTASKTSNVNFAAFNVLNLNALPGTFDTVITTRCLINLASWDEQADALLEMANKTRYLGRIIVVENFTDGLKNLNDLRRLFGLTEIKTRWHNLYIEKHSFEDFCACNRLVIKHKSNIGNLYYIVSRVVHAALAAQLGKEPEYEHPINQIAAKLPNLGNYNFSPNMLYVLEKK